MEKEKLLIDFIYGWENLSDPLKIILIVFYIIVGLFLLIKGGDWFVDAASWMAKKFGIPELLIGATIVSIATTMPEFLVSLFASLEGVSKGTEEASKAAVDMASGNAVGSVLANSGLILPLSLIFRPEAVKDRKSIIIRPLILLFSIFVLWICCLDKTFSWWEGVLMLLILIGFFASSIYEAKKQMKAESVVDERVKETEGKQERKVVKKNSKKEYFINFGLFFLGLAFIVVGAQLLVDNATEFAVELHVPQKIIALTVVAIGTSLPELITAISSIRKKQADISIGNIFGADIIDITLILSVCGFIYGRGLTVYDSTLLLDLPFAFGIVFLSSVPSMFTKKLQRWQGIVCLTAYAVYLSLYGILGL